MRFLFLSWRDLSHPLAGGSEVLVDNLARGVVARGHEAVLMCTGPVARRDYGVVSVGGTYSHYLRVPVRYLRRHRQADLVVDVVNGVPYCSPVWRRRPSMCLVNHIHTDHWGMWFPPPIAAIGRTVESRALPAVYRRRLVVAVSGSTASALAGLGVPPGQIRVVHNGVDSHEGRPVKSRPPLFVAVGRLVPHKRYDMLLRLWRTVGPATGGRLVIVGEGPEAERLRAKAGPNVSMPGRLGEEEKRRLLESAWLLVHPSMVEGWGLVVLEAAAFETPTLGFDVPGVRDSVIDGRTGRLAGSEEEMAKIWVELAADPTARRALGRGARDRARNLSWASTVSRFIEVAEEAVAGHRSTVPPAEVDPALELTGERIPPPSRVPTAHGGPGTA